MGGMVLRELLERNANVRSYFTGAILMGATPWGSVIADFKSRSDLFDDNYLQREEVSEIGASEIAKLHFLIPDHMAQLHASALRRNNIASMSHLNFKPRVFSEAFPVLNVIQLPDSLANYFQYSQEAKQVDPTFLLMSMYGPTEGSAPLAHAAWDTQKSARVFVSQFNHLGFWSLTPDQGVDYYVATLMTAQRLGLW